MMAEAKAAPAKGKDEPTVERTIEVWDCEVCRRSTGLDRCPRCGHSPKHDAARAKAREEAAEGR